VGKVLMSGKDNMKKNMLITVALLYAMNGMFAGVQFVNQTENTIRVNKGEKARGQLFYKTIPKNESGTFITGLGNDLHVQVVDSSGRVIKRMHFDLRLTRGALLRKNPGQPVMVARLQPWRSGYRIELESYRIVREKEYAYHGKQFVKFEDEEGGEEEEEE
jgi:hypothetical protein